MNPRLIALSILIGMGQLLSPSTLADESAVVLMYHRFGEDRYPSTSIRMVQFRQQLDYLRDGGFTIVPLRDLVEFLDGKGTLLPGAVAITVDDAYLSVYETAFPLLKNHGIPFTVFVSTDPVDQGLADYMNWEQMREMAANGITFANHGAGHISFVEKLAGESNENRLQRVRTDIDRARQRLEEEFSSSGGLLPDVFAYPYGEYDTDSAGLLQKRGYTAFGQQSGAVGRLSDRRVLPRFPMNEAYGGLDDFRTRVQSLPMPVLEVEPWDPVSADPLHVISITLAGTKSKYAGLACYISGQGRVELNWIEPGRRFSVGPLKPFGKGRHRVNCTTPGPDGRYFWFSHQWVIQ
jgi:peptidoglycan/xylan/chitin deacetylase (PgdA/CDA1 family)